MIEIDFKTAVNTLEQVVAGNETLVYQKPGKLCSYATGKNTPGCGVGQMFRRLGVSEEDLIKLDQVGAVETLSDPETQNIVSFADRRTVRFLDWFQFEQDRGTPWDKALAVAKKVIEAEDDD